MIAYHIINRNALTLHINEPVLYITQGLSQVEEMLISPILPMMSIYHLLLGQYGYIINLPVLCPGIQMILKLIMINYHVRKSVVTTPPFNNLTLCASARNYSIPSQPGTQLVC